MFDSFFCLPGIGGAHEKGGVEGEVGRFRRRHLVPVPEFDSIAELNEFLAQADVRDNDRYIRGRTQTVGQAAAQETALLRPLPVEGPFEAVNHLTVRVDAKARVCVRQAYYSVPARFAGRRADVRLGARTVAVYVDATRVADHPRLIHKYVESLVLDHYLEVLTHKPGALPGSKTLAQARAHGLFTPTHQRFWDQARRQHGDRDGTRMLIDVLLLHRTMSSPAVVAGMRGALQAGTTNPEVVTMEARRGEQESCPPPPVELARPVPIDDRPLPTLTGYDILLEARA